MHQAGAPRLGQELGAEADQPSGRHQVLHPDPAGAVVDHLLQPATPKTHQLGDDADEVFGDIHRQALDRLVEVAVDLRVTTCGLPTVSSKPSRRIISTRTASCSSPRPWTSQVSGRSVERTRIDTLPTSSASRRPLTRRAVRFLP